jgi:hypothetical protein
MTNDATRASEKALPEITRRKLLRFIDACMDPLPDSVLIDTQYNSMVRQTRVDAWRAAAAKTRCYKALLQVAWDTDKKSRYCVHAGVSIPSAAECLKLYRQALADQLLTPVEGKADIDWKRRQDCDYLPITEERVAKAIAADERFIAAHPTTRRACRRDGGEVL